MKTSSAGGAAGRRRWGRTILFTIALVLIVAFVLAGGAYLRDMRQAYARIAGSSTLFASPRGDIEYREGGSGIPVLVVHGSGGGFDQGELIAQAVLGDGFRWIAPSRFGYLRSTRPEGASFDDQAQAYVQLLDHLGIERVAVVALSHGGPSALLLAAQHPERVSSLTLISCGVASASDSVQAQANRKGSALVTIFRHDALYWLTSTLLRRWLIELMGADDEIIAALTPPQRRLVDQLIDRMNPVAPRHPGVTFDNEAALPNARIAAIRAPTLILHARDDRLQVFRNAEFAVATIPGARLQAFERGGHLLLAVEQTRIREATQDFIRAHIVH